MLKMLKEELTIGDRTRIVLLYTQVVHDPQYKLQLNFLTRPDLMKIFPKLVENEEPVADFITKLGEKVLEEDSCNIIRMGDRSDENHF